MGLVLSRIFSKRKKTPLEMLESLEEEIQSMEGDQQDTLQRQKKIVGRLIIYSVLLYVVAALLFYFCFFPASLKDRIFYIIPLLIFPIIVVMLKRLVKLYFKNEISRAKDKLYELRNKKKKILDEVMDKETYKVAKEILEKFAPDQLRGNSPNKTTQPTSGDPKLNNDPNREKSASPQAIPRPNLPTPPGISRPMVQQTEIPRPFPMGPQFPQQPPQQRRLIRPIPPQNRSIVDRLVEAIVGDGPQNKYALICKNCSTHNGMAFKEELEYLAFRCVYCGFFNPSRKSRTVVQSSSPRSADAARANNESIPEQTKITPHRNRESTNPSESQSEDEDAQQFNAGDSVIAPDLGGINSNKSLSPITLGGNDIVHSSPDTIRETSNDSKSSTESPKDSEAVESKKEK